ncbi:MAG: HDOD domain-containing protein [Chitinispirillales bacterium]|jgi:putative nucleotidyltransferase with HDIG domain|nr:HDOD domain-containing protein [Chitinispirillales bacterium]
MANERKVDTERIKKVAQSVIGLPTLPTVVSKMLEMVDSRRTSADTLARLISTDQALTARLLKLANSAYYGYQREVSTVNMAIVVLGFNTVKEVGLWYSVFDVFKNSGPAAAGFDAVKFWEHSAACGVAARMLSKTSGSRYSGEAFVAGLLHDMGKMILSQYFGAEFVEVIETAQSEGCGLDAAESEILGVSHGRVGAWLAEKWNLPAIICDTVKNHHAPWEAETEPSFVGMITVADILCHLTQIGDSGRKACPSYGDRLWQIFQSAAMPIDETDLERLQTDFQAEYGRSEAYISVVQETETGG